MKSPKSLPHPTGFTRPDSLNSQFATATCNATRHTCVGSSTMLKKPELPVAST